MHIPQARTETADVSMFCRTCKQYFVSGSCFVCKFMLFYDLALFNLYHRGRRPAKQVKARQTLCRHSDGPRPCVRGIRGVGAVNV
jgi:hypothetical protein